MLQSMMMPSITPLSFKREVNCWENQPFARAWPENNQLKTKEVTKTIKKKKRVRTAFTTEQLRTLERTYSKYKYINTEKRKEMAQSLEMNEKCIKVWFQNRRMKEKKELSESSCDSSNESVKSESFRSESVRSESVSITTPSPTPIKNDTYSNTSQYNPNITSECSYRLPPYANEVDQNMYGMQTYNVPAFYNDNNIYPTYYYPVNMNYSSVESNALNYYPEMNQYSTTNHISYEA